MDLIAKRAEKENKFKINNGLLSAHVTANKSFMAMLYQGKWDKRWLRLPIDLYYGA